MAFDADWFREAYAMLGEKNFGMLYKAELRAGAFWRRQRAGFADVTRLILNILPVHSQKRGKLFLPFVDEDPKTAEIMSKIVLLAQDKKIRDPFILEQICDRSKQKG